MKSQDILLLLALVALSERRGHSQDAKPDVARSISDWKNRDDKNTETETGHVSQQEEALQDPFSVRSLSSFTGISKSEISNVLRRCYQCDLAKATRGSSNPTVNTTGLFEFLAHGIRYVFPVKRAGLTRGIATGLTAPIFQGELKSAGDQTPVWPDAKGSTMGPAVEPLFRTVPIAVRNDNYLYMLLALVDSIRLGLPRERNLAISKLETMLKR